MEQLLVALQWLQVNVHRLIVPKSMKEESLSKGEHTYLRDDNMLMIRLGDKKEIYFLSTIHNIIRLRAATIKIIKIVIVSKLK